MAYVNSTVVAPTGNSNTIVIAVPTGTAAGQIAIIGFANDSNAANCATAMPTGFTALSANLVCTADGQAAAIGYKRLTGADSGNYTSGNVGAVRPMAGFVALFDGRHATDNPTMTSTIQNTAQSSPITVTAPTLTMVAGDDAVWFVFPDVTSATVYTGTTPPASPGTWTERGDAANATGWSNVEAATQANFGAGATGSVSGTVALSSNTAGWICGMVRIPAAAGGGGGATDLPPRRTLLGVGR